MKILKLELQNFGKFQNEVLELNDGIQLFYGENESGKTTIHTFIKSMLFGMERGRGRAAANDTFSRYEPWENPGYYAGAMEFECGKKRFRLERSFDKYSKRASLVCLDDGEEFSLEQGDLMMLLPELDPEGYSDTLYIGQAGVRTGRNLAARLKDYATNYYVTGDSELNLTAARNALDEQKKQLDRQMKEKLEKKQRQREKLEQESSYIWRDVHRLDEELERIDEALERKEAEEKEKENRRVLDDIRPNKWRIHPLEVAGILLVIVGAFVLIARPWNYLVAIIIALIGGIYSWNRLKEGKKRQKTPPELMLEEITPEEELSSREKLLWERTLFFNEKEEKRIQYENLQEQLAELEEFDQSYKRLEEKKAAVLLASQRLLEVSGKMQGQLQQDLNRTASDVISSVTGGKYTRLITEEDLRLSFLCEGRKIPAEHVSAGTLEQVYFALRMSAANLLYEEVYPVVLDDTFAFYDESRLKNTLQWLARQDRQILIFTCQKREEEILLHERIDHSVHVLT